MGRAKLEIRRLETVAARQGTFLKRKAGILKKAKELSILCDIDIILLMFSPNGKSTLFVSEHSNIEEVVAKFAQLTPQERSKRKLESLEALKKTFKKIDHQVTVADYMGSSTQTVEELTAYSRLLQAQLSEMQKRLSNWSDIENIDDIEQLKAMEDSLKQSFSQLQVHKETFEKQQFLSLGCTNQFQNGMQLPMLMKSEQQSLPMSWLSNSDAQQLVLPDETVLLTQRDIGCSTSTSLQAFHPYFSADKQRENEPAQEDSLAELSHPSLRLHLQEQYPYQTYDPSLLTDDKFQPRPEIGLQEAPTEYQLHHFDPHRPMFHGDIQDWASTSSGCGIAMFDGHSHPQQNHTM